LVYKNFIGERMYILREKPLIYRRPVIKYLFPVKVSFDVVDKNIGVDKAKIKFKIKVTRRGLPLPFARYEVVRNDEVIGAGRTDRKGEGEFEDAVKPGHYLYYCFSPTKEWKGGLYWGCSDGVVIDAFTIDFKAIDEKGNFIAADVSVKYEDKPEIFVQTPATIVGFGRKYTITYPEEVYHEEHQYVFNEMVIGTTHRPGQNKITAYFDRSGSVVGYYMKIVADTKISFSIKPTQLQTGSKWEGRGRLLDVEGGAVPHERVHLEKEGEGKVDSKLTDDDGSFIFERVEDKEGTYKYRAVYEGNLWNPCQSDWIEVIATPPPPPPPPPEPKKGNLRGWVRSYDTGDPIEGATVTCQDKSAKSDSDGYFIIRDLNPGTDVEVTASASGYKPQTKHVDIPEGETAEVNFDLRSEGEPPKPWVRIEDIWISDESGNTVTKPKAGRNYVVNIRVKNLLNKELEGTVLVQIKDELGHVVKIYYSTATWSPGETKTFGWSWVPTQKYKYTLEGYVWKSLTEPEPYCSPYTKDITVDP